MMMVLIYAKMWRMLLIALCFVGCPTIFVSSLKEFGAWGCPTGKLLQSMYTIVSRHVWKVLGDEPSYGSLIYDVLYTGTNAL